MPPHYLALLFPFLSADRLRLCAPAEPFATVEKVKGAMRLAAVSRQALGLGLRPGLALADALARVPNLQTAEHDIGADTALLARLARACRDTTPTVELLPPDALLLEIGGSAHLFGGETALRHRLVTRLQAMGMTVATAFGDTPDAAMAFARHPQARGAVGRLPVAALGLGVESVQALRQAGLRTVGDVARLPRAAIAARFGHGAANALDRLAGHRPRPLEPRRPRRPIRVDQRLPEPLLSADVALRLLEALCARACRRLEVRGAGGRRFEAHFFRTDGDIRMLMIESSRPLREPAAIMRLFAERIEGLADPLDPGFGFDRIALAVPATERLEAAAPGLPVLAGADGRDGLSDLVDRLSTRFGADAIRRLRPLDSHLPERAESWGPAEEPVPGAWPAPEAPRPLLLLDPPEPVDVVAEVPEGPPHRFRWRRRQHRVVLAEGPERIAAEWWRRRDGGLREAGTRDYWRVEDMEGRRFWLFRRGLYRERPDPAWFLHGLFP
jgi:protein ImuB